MMNEMKLIMNLKEGLFTLNDGTLDALGRPRQIQLLINVNKKMLVLRACGTEDVQAFVLPSEPVISTDISGRTLLKNIRQQMGWEDEMTRECTGSYFPMHHAVSFDLSRVRIADTGR